MDMTQMEGLGWTFDTASSLYEKIRPGYPDALYQTVFNYVPLRESSRVVEIGPGAGQATLPFLKTGCRLTAVEPGRALSGLCREKFQDYPSFSLITDRFENVDFAADTYDLVFAATAFHWVPEAIGCPKILAMLKKGGAFAQFANHPFRSADNPALAAEIDRLYETYYDRFYNKQSKPLREYAGEQADRKARAMEQYGFRDVTSTLFYRTRILSAKEYVMLLGTYSDHIAIEERVRKEFFAEMEKAIRKHGGRITVRDTLDLQLGRKA